MQNDFEKLARVFREKNDEENDQIMTGVDFQAKFFRVVDILDSFEMDLDDLLAYTKLNKLGTGFG